MQDKLGMRNEELGIEGAVSRQIEIIGAQRFGIQVFDLLALALDLIDNGIDPLQLMVAVGSEQFLQKAHLN